MGRKSTLNQDKVFAAVSAALVEEGSVSLHTVVSRTGVSIGSLYHRYGSREGLMAHAWLDAVTAFQADVQAALTDASARAGLGAALTTPQFCRSSPERAVILACCRRSEFLSDALSDDLKPQVEQANTAATAAVRAYADGMSLPFETCLMAIVGVPLGLVRLYLPDRAVPLSVDEAVKVSFDAIMGTRLSRT